MAVKYDAYLVLRIQLATDALRLTQTTFWGLIPCSLLWCKRKNHSYATPWVAAERFIFRTANVMLAHPSAKGAGIEPEQLSCSTAAGNVPIGFT